MYEQTGVAGIIYNGNLINSTKTRFGKLHGNEREFIIWGRFLL